MEVHWMSDLTNRLILVIEDDEDAQENLKNALGRTRSTSRNRW